MLGGFDTADRKETVPRIDGRCLGQQVAWLTGHVKGDPALDQRRAEILRRRPLLADHTTEALLAILPGLDLEKRLPSFGQIFTCDSNCLVERHATSLSGIEVSQSPLCFFHPQVVHIFSGQSRFFGAGVLKAQQELVGQFGAFLLIPVEYHGNRFVMGAFVDSNPM